MRPAPRDIPAPARTAWWWIAAAFACVAGIRLLLIAAWAGVTPYFDDWNGTGWLHINAATSAHGIPWSWLVYPHAEHLLVAQRMFSLGVAALNGQEWDVRAELMVAAFAWGSLAAILVGLGRREFSPRALWAWVTLVLAAEALPHAWENLLWSFQIHFLFLVTASLLALRLLTLSRPFSTPWFAGMICAAAAYLSQASGLVVLLVAAFVLLLNLLTGKTRHSVRSWSALVVLAMVAAAAKSTLPAAAWVENLHVHDVSTWLRAAGDLLAWPWSGHGALAAIMWLPAAWFIGRNLFRRGEWPERDVFWFAVAVWSLALIAASAWARGTMLVRGITPSRYGDVLVIGLLVNAFLVLRWADRAIDRRRIRALAAAAWTSLAVAGLAIHAVELDRAGTAATTINAFSRREFTRSRSLHEDAVRSYLRSHDPADLKVEPPMYPVPEHTAELIDRLRSAKRWPAALDADSARALPPLSRAARAMGGWGWAVLAAGVIFAAIAAVTHFGFLFGGTSPTANQEPAGRRVAPSDGSNGK